MPLTKEHIKTFYDVKNLGYDLLGNTVVVPAIEEVSKRVLKIYY